LGTTLPHMEKARGFVFPLRGPRFSVFSSGDFFLRLIEFLPLRQWFHQRVTPEVSPLHAVLVLVFSLQNPPSRAPNPNLEVI